MVIRVFIYVCWHVRVAAFGREERNRVVPPVIGQPLVKEIAIVEEGVDREELNRGHAEFAQVVHHCGVSQSTVCAPEPFRNSRVELRIATDMHLIDDRALPSCAGRPILTPSEGGIYDAA